MVNLPPVSPLAEIRDLEEINRGLSLEDDKPQGRIIEFALLDEGGDELIMDEEEQQAAAIGTRPISEILSMVDSQLGITPEADESEDETSHGDDPGRNDDNVSH